MSVITETFYDATQKIWSGSKRADLYGPQATLGGEILKVLKSNPSKVVQICDPSGNKTTADELLRNSELIADEFLKLGLKPGDVIGVYASNTNNLSAVILASLFCGTPFNALYSAFDKDEIQQIFELTTPKIVCCDLENYETLKKALIEMKSEAIIYIINGKITNVRSIEDVLRCSNEHLGEKSFPGLGLNGDATAAIVCSSGTTGQPKGVLVSHSSILNNNVFFDISSESVLFNYSPLFWISGLWSFLTPLLNGATRIITNQQSTPEIFLNIIQKYSVTHILASTSFMTQLVKESKMCSESRLRSVHCLLYGGAKVPTGIAESLYKIFNSTATIPGPILCYGMTELGGMLSETHTGPMKRRYDTEGKLMPNMEVRITDRDTGVPLGPNETGFILVRSPYKWAGYYRNPEATEKVYQNGWINTGDVGFFDDEGYLSICARESDIFKSFNFQIYPDRLEDLVIQMPGVTEVCVFGVPDLVATNLIACAVVRTNDIDGAALTSEHVVAYLNEHASKAFHITGGVYFLEQLPKTASGKLLRRKVYDLIKES